MADSTAGTGDLSFAEATQRLLRHGPHLITASRPHSLWIDVLSRFRNPRVLLAASAVPRDVALLQTGHVISAAHAAYYEKIQ
jgi:hypothetical protein